jgi:hypothetical protein
MQMLMWIYGCGCGGVYARWVVRRHDDDTVVEGLTDGGYAGVVDEH